MRSRTHFLAVVVVSLCLSPGVGTAQAVPIREETPGLLAQAKVAPTSARLAAFAELPGAQMVAATIERLGNRLVYSFDLKYADHGGNEHVVIDAISGKPIYIEYCVELDSEGNLVMAAAPEIVADTRAHFVAARNTALAQVPEGHMVRSRLRVQPSFWVYLFDIEVGDGPLTKRVLIRASTGAVISVQPM